MSLFPTLLLAVSLLGLLGEFPATCNAIVRHLRHVVPAVTLAALDAAVRAALKSRGTAAAGLVIAILTRGRRAHGDRRHGGSRSAHGDRAAHLSPSGQGPGR